MQNYNLAYQNFNNYLVLCEDLDIQIHILDNKNYWQFYNYYLNYTLHTHLNFQRASIQPNIARIYSYYQNKYSLSNFRF